MTKHSGFASDFIARYFWKNNNQDLIRAKMFFSKAVDLWAQASPDAYLEGKCVLGISALDLYQATQNSDYLDFAESFFEKEKISSLCLESKKEGVSNYCYDSLFEQTTCGIFVHQLSLSTEKQEYENIYSNLVSNILNNLFNIPEYDTGEESKGSCYSEATVHGNKTYIHKSVRENGLLVGFLMTE